MKQITIRILVLLLLSSVLLSSCAQKAPEPPDTTESPTESLEPPTESDTSDTGKAQSGITAQPYTVKESYMPLAVSAQMKQIFESQSAEFITYSYGSCPYVIRDVYTISNCRLLSISIPVSKTLAADANGNFTFTITVGNNEWYQLQNTPRKVVTVIVNGAEHGISANTAQVNRWIKVDLTSYDLKLSENETVGFGKNTDTLIPAYMGSGDSTNLAQRLIEESFPQMRGFVSKMGLGQTIGTSSGTLIYDFEWERTYASEKVYQEKVAEEAEYQRVLVALKEKYAGKKLSILGDSISTFEGYSNNTAYNATIGGNELYYNKNGGGINKRGLYDHRDTYWYRLISELDMELCVNNAWSGSRVLDAATMPARAGQLHNAGGEKPDVILFYMGINDLHNETTGQFGDLYAILTDANDTSNNNAKIDRWLSTVEEANLTTFEQSYAMALKTMISNYPDAEIWCMTLTYNKDSRFTEAAMTKYNLCITALANYFGCNVIDQTKGYITPFNCVRYSCDNKGLHPNPTGHALMEKHIVETLYAKSKQN
ncbi:MAG: hypothetical protein IJW44_02980 [Clostridia bacterium]|nr:hypothetical protein [Clostridia bacterium]